MWIERAIDLNSTIYVKQSHKTCKLDPNKWILSCQKVGIKKVSTKAVGQLLSNDDRDHLNTDHCWPRGGVFIFNDVICEHEQPLMTKKQCRWAFSSSWKCLSLCKSFWCILAWGQNSGKNTVCISSSNSLVSWFGFVSSLLKDKDHKDTLLLWCQGSFSLLWCFSNDAFPKYINDMYYP